MQAYTPQQAGVDDLQVYYDCCRVGLDTVHRHSLAFRPSATSCVRRQSTSTRCNIQRRPLVVLVYSLHAARQNYNCGEEDESKLL